MTLDISPLRKGKQRTPRSDLDVIRMGCKADELNWARRQAQFPHRAVESTSGDERAKIRGFGVIKQHQTSLLAPAMYVRTDE